MTDNIKNYVIALTIILIGAFYLVTIRPGANWGGDSFMYIRHAINMADGIKYSQTGYIYNPHAFYLGPKTVPPVCPLLLTFVYKIFGFNLLAMKVETCFIILIFLSLLVPLIRHRFSFASLLGLLVLFSFNPLILDFKFLIGSDIPFLMFIYWSLLLIHKFYENEKLRVRFSSAVYLGVIIYLCYGTRSAGVVLLPSLLVYEFINWRRISARTFVTLAVFFFLALIQWVFFHNDGDYLKIISHNDMVFALRNNLHGFLDLWIDDFHPKVQVLLFLSLLFFVLSGFVSQVRRRISITDIFFIVYCMSIFIWPPGGFRYFLPIIPLFIFYLLCGVEFWVTRPFPPMFAVIRSVILAVLLVVMLFSYGSRYRHWDYLSIPEGPYKPESQELFQFIREKTPQDAIFVFRDPRCLSFFTSRKAAVYYRPVDQEELWQYMRSIQARYLIEATFHMGGAEEDKLYLSSFIERYQNQLKEVFINKHFRVFEIVE